MNELVAAALAARRKGACSVRSMMQTQDNDDKVCVNIRKSHVLELCHGWRWGDGVAGGRELNNKLSDWLIN